ncbi:hypothetical protein GCM10011385_01460 [Nitratireductor aestuarii]|uniref:Peptidase U49, Lit peptidase n=1 Tax=Nitratireductor aestuarii TaxID=1735103 RepID=A0A916RDJ0_9HYPH|nr:phage exclusion protein Lit family protein [Nitratireductor aestuarii]GGA51852.1 hypothetical protein GCM10011385_01460 [Nitratireductor aestuarii]
MASVPSDRTIVLHLLRGAVPERADDLSRLWREHGHEVEIAPSAHGSTMNATSKRIKFDTKTIDFFWLLGFSAWRAIEVYAPALTLATATGITLEAALNIDNERGQFEQDYKHRISSAKSLLNAAATFEIEWPEDIPQPTADRESLSNGQDKAVFDLVALALAFALLHEFKHVQARAVEAAEQTPEDDRQAAAEEEMACDTWARNFMTTGIDAYAQSHDHTYGQVEQKRAMGIALAAVIIHAMTPLHAHWGSDDYPPIGDRLEAMIGGYNLPDASAFWVFTACLLIALMRQDGRRLDYTGSSFREFVMTLLAELR